MAAPAPPQAPNPPPLPDINVLYGAPSIGLIVASFMSGIVTTQAFLYYRAYPKDHIAIKVMVAVIWVLDLGHLISIAQFIYYYTITHWGDPTVFSKLTWSWGVEILFNTLITAICQFFLTYRVKVVSNGNWWITSVLGLLALMQLGCGVTSAGLGLRKGSTLEGLAGLKVLASVWLFSGAVNDALIALCLGFYLHKKRSEMSSAIVDRLILYIISTGGLTSVIAFADIIAFLAMPNNFIHLALNFPLGRIYTNSLLSSLNIRQSLRGHHTTTITSSHGGHFNVSIHKTTDTTVDSVHDVRRAQPFKDEEISMNPLNLKGSPDY